MGEVVAGIAYGLKEVAEGAVLVAKGIYDPTLPLKATLQPLTSVSVPLAHQTVAVIKGRAYLFGGKAVSEDGSLKLASNDMHVVILPSSGMESTDYKKIDATSDAPPKRSGHTAAVIDDQIYVYGGCGEDGEPLDEGGSMWMFDTVSDKWSHLDPPANSKRPDARTSHACVASEHPRPKVNRPDEGTLPQDPPDPESTIPEIPDADTYGTVIVQGGLGKEGTQMNDMWTFDVSTRTWTELPDPPPPSPTKASFSLVDRRLYVFSAGQTSYLDLTPGSFNDRAGQGELGVAPLGPWQTLPPTSSAPENAYPGERTGASMAPVTTGQGRNYLLLIGGQSQLGEPLEDIWTLQLKPEGMTAASFKDAARMAIKKDTYEASWEEVKYHNADGVMIQEGQDGRGIGRREGFAAAKGTEVDGSSVLLWGGIGDDGRPRGDGLIIIVTA